MSNSEEINKALHRELNEAIDGLMGTKLLEEKLRDTQNELLSYKESNNEDNKLKEENSFLKSELEVLHSKFEDKFINLKDSLEKKNKELEKDNTSLQDFMNRAVNEKNMLKEELGRKEKQIADLTAKLNEYENSYLERGSQYDDQTEILQNKLSTAEEVNQELKECLDIMEKKLEENNNKEDTLPNLLKVAYQIDRIGLKITGKDVLSSQLSLLREKEDAYNHKDIIDILLPYLSSLSFKAELNATELRKAKKEDLFKKKLIEEKTKIIQELEETQEDLKTDLLDAETYTEEMSEEIDSLYEKIKQLENEKEMIKTTKESQNTSNHVIKDLEKRIEKLKREKTKIETVNEKLFDFLPDQESRYLVEHWAQINTEMYELENQLLDLQVKNNGKAFSMEKTDLKADLSLKRQTEDLKNEITYKQKRKDHLESSLYEIKQKIQTREEELDKYKKETEMLRVSLKNQQKVDKLNSSFTSLRSRKSCDKTGGSYKGKKSAIFGRGTKTQVLTDSFNFLSVGMLHDKKDDYSNIREKINSLKNKYKDK